MGRSCIDVAQSLVQCMKDTPCVRAGGDIRRCMREHAECGDLRRAYFQCKRDGLDMRTRIQGQKVY